MSNKKYLLREINNDFDKEKNYEKIIKNINKKNNIVFFKYAIPVIIFLLLIIPFFLSNKKMYVTDNSEKNDLIKINDKTDSWLVLNVSKTSSGLYDINIPYFEFTKDIRIPNDFDNKDYKEMFYNDKNTRDQNDNVYYKFHFFNTKNERYILIAFSEVKDNINMLKEEKNDKVSFINNKELFIYKSGNKYLTSFEYNDLFFYIETTSISEKELVDLLESIIK